MFHPVGVLNFWKRAVLPNNLSVDTEEALGIKSFELKSVSYAIDGIGFPYLQFG